MTYTLLSVLITVLVFVLMRKDENLMVERQKRDRLEQELKDERAKRLSREQNG